MPENATPIPGRERLWRVGLALVPALVLVLLRGADANWDLRNYHLYNPHAWLSGRMLWDVAPAQLQSFHNPLLDLPLYWIVQSGADLRWASAWLALPWVAAIYLLLDLQARLSPRRSLTAQVVLALLALSGATTWATLGNSMNDGFVAAALLGSLWLLLATPLETSRRWLFAGLLAGAVTGLKLTAGAYCLGLAAMACVAGTHPGWRARVDRLAWLGLGGLVGFVLGYGFWGWTLAQAFGNPFFPYFNDVFASPWAPARSFVDGRFRAHGLLDAVTIPLQLLVDDTARSELRLRDPRLLLGAVGFPLLAWRLARMRSDPAHSLRRLAVFFWVSLLAWALQYGIYRYAATLELLGVLSLSLWLARLPRGSAAASLLALVLVSVATRRPNWGHVRDASPRYGLVRPALPADALVLVGGGEPLAYLALGLPPGTRMVGLQNNFLSADGCSGLEVRARGLLRSHADRIWLVSGDERAAARELEGLAARFPVARRAGPQVRYSSSLGEVVFTPLEAARTPDPCP